MNIITFSNKDLDNAENSVKDDDLKFEIQEWLNKYKEKNYCDDIFLEDMIINIK